MPDQPTFQQFQFRFTAHLRDPQQPVPAGVAAERIEVYAELLFNNLRGFIDACCPICREIAGESRWEALLRAFYRDHRCHSPLFRDIPRDFVHWLAGNPAAAAELPAFMAELAHYEWLELAADVHPAQVPATGAVGDVFDTPLQANPTLHLGVYQWPVQQIAPACQPASPGSAPTCLAVYRDAQDTVRFTLLNPLSAHLLGLLQAQPQPGRDALQQLAHDAGIAPEPLAAFGRDLLQQWLAEALLHPQQSGPKPAAGSLPD